MNDTQLELVLEHVGEALGERPVVVSPLDSMSNAAWRVSLRAGEAVLRTQTLDFGAPVTDHARELAIHGLAAAAGFAPGIVFSDARSGVIVTDFEHAGTYTEAAFSEPGIIERIAERLAAMHAIEVPGTIGSYSLAAAADRYLARAGVTGEAQWDALASQVRDVEAGASTADQVLCHRDLLHANILASEPVQFIDWEFASVGERWFDLASLAVWQHFDETQVGRMLNAYLGRSPDAHERERVAQNAVAFRALCQLWELPPATTGS